MKVIYERSKIEREKERRKKQHQRLSIFLDMSLMFSDSVTIISISSWSCTTSRNVLSIDYSSGLMDGGVHQRLIPVQNI